ncbi:MAG: glycosyltransferase [Oscillospiraceae bacterium]|nr:glycosyltransferase [Oscillospiraceae bacterium]
MKILQVNCVYNNGSTGKIVYDIHSGLRQRGIESVVCYGRGAASEEDGVYKVCGELYSKLNNLRSRFTGLMYGGCRLSTDRLIAAIEREQPDVVHLHCINGYFVNIYRLISWLKEHRVKTVLTLHAEFMHTANCGYALDCDRWRTGCGSCPQLRQETKSILFDRTAESWSRMRAAFEGFDTLRVVAVSPWLRDRAEQSPVFGGRLFCVILNGVDTGVFRPENTDALKAGYGFEGRRVIFHATPNFNLDPEHIKGGYYVLRLAESMRDDKVAFVVAGEYDKNIVPPDNLRFVGAIRDQSSLARHYAMADMTLLASRKEAFSMITAESLCCGTPVVGFEAGAPEQIALPQYSGFVKWGDVDALRAKAREFMDGRADRDEIAAAAAEKYSRDKMCEEYIGLYESLCGGAG